MKIVETIINVILLVLLAVFLVTVGWLLRGLKVRKEAKHV